MTNHRRWMTDRSISDAAGPATIRLRLKAGGECGKRENHPASVTCLSQHDLVQLLRFS